LSVSNKKLAYCICYGLTTGVKNFSIGLPHQIYASENLSALDEERSFRHTSKSPKIAFSANGIGEKEEQLLANNRGRKAKMSGICECLPNKWQLPIPQQNLAVTTPSTGVLKISTAY
jgi:hypothetical protein